MRDGRQWIERFKRHEPEVVGVMMRHMFNRIEIDEASLPYYPEMLDFELTENAPEEQRELREYRDSFT